MNPSLPSLVVMFPDPTNRYVDPGIQLIEFVPANVGPVPMIRMRDVELTVMLLPMVENIPKSADPVDPVAPVSPVGPVGPVPFIWWVVFLFFTTLGICGS